jgi:eukaryotic-like serine/threonine-protein kinase
MSSAEHEFQPGETRETPAPGASSQRDILTEGIADPVAPASTAGALELAEFEALEEIGRGGVGIVYRARDPRLGRDLAVKVLRPDRLAGPALVRRFMEEAHICGQLQHPGVVPVHALGKTADGQPYFTMKLIRGRTLATFLAERSEPGQELPRFLKIFEQVCQTLGYAHSQGIIHRDLKPANIMIGAFGEVQVMDWGLAKMLRRSPGRDQESGSSGTAGECGDDHATDHQTQGGLILGTFAYMPPEQARGEVALLNERSDVFSLGALLCEILTRQPPYRGGDRETRLRQARDGDLADCRQRLNQCGADGELLSLARHCLSPAMEDRPANAGEVAQALARYHAGVEERLQRAHTERAAAEIKAAEERKRRKWAIGFAAAILLLVIGACVAALWYENDRAFLRVRHDNLEHDMRLALDQGGRIRSELHQTLQKAGGVQELLNQPARWQAYVKTAQAELERASSLSATAQAPVDPALIELRASLERDLARDETDYLVALRLEKIHLDTAAWVDGKFDHAGAAREYPKAFRQAGISIEAGLEEETARRIEQSAIREQLLAALHNWADSAGRAGDDALRKLLERTARRSEGDSRAGLFWDKLRDHNALQKLVAETLADRKLFEGLPPNLLHQVPTYFGRQQSEAWLRRARDFYPMDFWINFELAGTLSEKPETQREAVGFYWVALAIRPDTATVYNNLSGELRKLKDLIGAGDAAQKATRLDPKLIHAWNNLALALSEQNDLPGAVKAFHAAQQIDPDDLGTLVSFGNVLAKHKDFDGAVAVYERVLQVRPRETAVLIGLGHVMKDQKRFTEANDYYQRAIAVGSPRPFVAIAWSSLGRIAADRRDYPAAINAYQKAIKISPKERDYWNALGLAQHNQKNHAAARESFEKALAIDPHSLEALTNLGSAYLDQKELAVAINTYKRVLSINPKFEAAWCNLGHALADQKDLPGAIACYEKAIQCDPKSVTAWNNLGAARRAERNHPTAIAAFRKVLELEPDHAMAWYNLGIIFLAQKDVPEAVDALRKSVKADPKDAKAWYNLGNALRDQYNLGDGPRDLEHLKEAAQAYEQAIKARPDYAEAYCNLGFALQAQGRLAESLAAMKKGHDLGSRRTNWTYPSPDWLKDCKRLADLEKRLPAVLQGEVVSAADYVALAGMCSRYLRRYPDAAKLFAQAFAADPALADKAAMGYRSQAAGAAVMAAADMGVGASLDDQERARWRQQALAWLQADLAAFNQTSATTAQRALLLKTYRRWTRDDYLAGVRTPQALAELPSSEQAAWRQLWTDVERVVATAPESDAKR